MLNIVILYCSGGMDSLCRSPMCCRQHLKPSCIKKKKHLRITVSHKERREKKGEI